MTNTIKSDNAPPDKKQNKKKNIPLGKVLFAGFGIASCAYLLSALLKGEFKFNSTIKEIYNKNSDEINKFLNGETPDLSDNVKCLIDEAKKKYKSRSKKVDIFKFIRNLITKRSIKINGKNLAADIDAMIAAPEGKEIEGLLQNYRNMIGKDEFPKFVKENKILTGFYNGLSKVAKTIYQAFSLPGILIKKGLDNTIYKDSSQALKRINTINFSGDRDKEISEIIYIIDKAKKKYPNDKDKMISESVKAIKKNIRNFSDNPETGELAHYTRTCVTLLSSYFFVNDYRNRVLIESGGKDTEKAEEEKNERIAHKFANFVVNGTLMNLFNSVGKEYLNKNLFWATLIPAATELTNETLVRTLINQPIMPKGSKQAIIDFEIKQSSKKGIRGMWTKFYRKLTGKKSLSEKAGINLNKNSEEQTNKIKKQA